MKNNFENTHKLIGFILKRERIVSFLWIALISLFSVALAPGLANIFDARAREALIPTVNNPAMIAMLGPIYGIENYTCGAMYFNMMVQWVMLAAAVMNIFFVVRHTRGDEERGRVDLLRALPIGRFSILLAVMLAAFLMNFAVAFFTGAGIGLCGVEGMGWNGAMLYGSAIGSAGFVFAAIAAVFSQLCMTSRGAAGLSVITLGGLYLLRGAGDIGNEMLSYISPLGLAQRTQAFVKNNWMPIVILIAEAVIITAAAALMNIRRDLGRGIIPARKGKEKAGAYLHSASGLAFRLLMPLCLCWVLGIFAIGASYGSILGTIDTFVKNSEFYSMIIGLNSDFSTAQMFVSMVTSIIALCSAIPVISVIMKFRSQEKDGYYLNVLSKAVSKERYLAGYLFIAFVTAILVQCAAALGIYASAYAVLPDPNMLTLGYLLKANLVYLPAVLVMLGAAVLAVGAVPKALPAVWIYFGFSFFAVFLRRLPEFIPEWMVKLTPFGWIPSLPVDEINFAVLAVLTVIAFLLILAGAAAYRRRDIYSD